MSASAVGAGRNRRVFLDARIVVVAGSRECRITLAGRAKLGG